MPRTVEALVKSKLRPFLKVTWHDADGNVVFKGFDLYLDDMTGHARKACYSDPCMQAEVARMHWITSLVPHVCGRGIPPLY